MRSELRKLAHVKFSIESKQKKFSLKNISDTVNLTLVFIVRIDYSGIINMMKKFIMKNVRALKTLRIHSLITIHSHSSIIQNNLIFKTNIYI